MSTPMPESAALIGRHLNAVQHRIREACVRAGRPEQSVRLLAVSKTFPAEDVRAAFAAGQRAFGENYVQEGVDKVAALADLRDQLEWHFIGPLQSNKSRPVAESFDWVHSIDRLRIATRLSEQRPADLPPLNVCVQVNISDESSKSGVAPAEALALMHAIAALPRLRLRGLMAIPAPLADAAAAPEAILAQQRAPFLALRTLFDQACAAGLALDTISAGMSADIEAAILEGATLVRIGTAIFGHRDYGTPAPA